MDLSPDGSLLLTCALVHQLRRDDADDAADHSSSSSSARHPRMHNVSPHSHSEMINSNERYRGRLPVTVSSLTAATAPRVHLTYDPNPAPSAPVSFSTSNIRIARNAARLRAMTAASYRNFIESNGPDISALDIGQLGGDIIMNTSINTNSRPRNVITSSNSRHSSSYINYPYNHTSHHRVLNSGAPNSISAHRTDSSASSFTTAVPSQRSSLHPNAGAISTTTDPPTHAFPLLPPQRWDHNVPPFQGHVDRKDDDSLGLSSPVSADTIPTGAMEPLSMNPLPSLSTSVLGDMNSSLLGSHHGNQHQMQQAHRPSILPNNITEGRRRYQLNYHMSSIEDLSHSRVVSSDTSDLSFNREDSSHTGG